MQKVAKPLARIIPLLLFVVTSYISSLPAAEKLTAEQVAALMPQLFKLHLSQREMDEPFLRRMLKEYLNQLDPSKNFYLKTEADAITNLTVADLNKIRDQSMDGDFSHFKGILESFLQVQIARDAAMYEGLEKRIDDVKAKLDELMKPKVAVKPDGTPVLKNGDPAEKKDEPATNEEGELDNIKWNERPADHAEREKRLLSAAAALFRINKSYLSEVEAFKLAVQTLQEDRNKWLRIADGKIDEQVPKLFLKSFMDSMDPHTDYFDNEEDEDFTERLERSFAGIGVQIRPCPLGAQIEDIIKGGPAEKSKKFARGDQIVAVDEFALKGLPISKIVKRIKGKIGTEVKLTVLKRETRTTEVIPLKRDTIELGEMRVKGKKYETDHGVIGLISVQTFYRDVHRDVRERLKELGKDAPLAGVVLDLRFNHGGYLEEAVRLAGLFLEDGAVVGERDGQDHEDWKYDPDSNADYTGPLVVLINQFSASASEIVAGTLKDYGRAVVVGHTQSFGKGTVQRVIPLSTLNLPGEIKITTHQYFLAGGASVQLKGVEPDVIIPGAKLAEEDGMLERSSENAVPFNTIKGKLNQSDPDVKLWNEWKKINVAVLQEKSNKRSETNTELRDFYDPKKRKEKAEAEAAEEKKRAELEKLDPNAPPPLTDNKKEEKDPQADEAVAVVKDMVGNWPGMVKQVAK